MTTKQYSRPDTASPVEGEAGLSNRNKFQDISATRPRIPISSEDIDSEFNNLIDAVNELYDTAISGAVPDNSITLAKLSHLTAGSMYYMNGSAEPTELTVGTSGQVLTSNGTIPAWADPSEVPVGTLLDYAGSTAPTGYLLCDGSAVSRSTYSDLFAVISTTYGSGDGSTTFNLPDFRGRVAIAKDDLGGTSADRITDANADTLGGTGGSEKVTPQGSITINPVTLVEANLPAHSHAQRLWDSTAGALIKMIYSAAVGVGCQTKVWEGVNNLGTVESEHTITTTLYPCGTATPHVTTEDTGSGSSFTPTGSFTGTEADYTQPWMAVTKIIKT